MPLFLPFLALGLPLVEIAGFVLVGERIGVSATLALTALTAAAGLLTLRFQLLSLPALLRGAVAGKEPPIAGAAVELARTVAGLLLLIPGFFSDLLGLLLLVPPLRKAAVHFLLGYLARHVRPRKDDTIIDVTYTDVTPTPQDKRLDGKRAAPKK